MLDWTDRHCRYFLRLISQKVYLYTEMITTGAILYGQADRYLAFDPFEKPVALQLGGSDPQALAICARQAEQYGYDEINFNVGCPSERVQKGRLGACLMKEPDLVAKCLEAMQKAVSIPVTVKTRIGVDDQDSYEDLCRFTQTISQAGCETFIIHARKAWLKGLSPKQNREIPPLRYDIVKNLASDFQNLCFILNGGIMSLSDAKAHLDNHCFAGVMLGRAVYHSPYVLLHAVDQAIFQERNTIKRSREDVLAHYLRYACLQKEKGVSSAILMRPLFGLYKGLPNSKKWRRELAFLL